MKYILLAFIMIVAGSASAQADTISAPYQKFPNNIPLKLLLTDSTSLYTAANLPSKRPFMILLFSPDCEHCKKATTDIVAHIDLFKEVDLIMATPKPFDEMKKFYLENGLDKFPNLIMGRDQNILLPGYYAIRYFPFHAFYGKKKRFIAAVPQGLTAAEMAAQFAN